ncbi:MAG: hypothetical protein AAB416_04405 [Patescibacteria group bacterium]
MGFAGVLSLVDASRVSLELGDIGLPAHGFVGLGEALTKELPSVALMECYLKDLTDLAATLKVTTRQESITYTVPALPNGAISPELKRRLVVNLEGHLLAYLALRVRERIEEIRATPVLASHT